jgi:hypothetical protein
MPNDCWNDMTITGFESDITSFFENELKDVPESALKMKVRGVKGLIFSLWSPSRPDFKWLESLFKKYPSIWVKNEWSEEGGLAGVWVGTEMYGELKIDQMVWTDLCLEEKVACFREVEA